MNVAGSPCEALLETQFEHGSMREIRLNNPPRGFDVTAEFLSGFLVSLLPLHRPFTPLPQDLVTQHYPTIESP